MAEVEVREHASPIKNWKQLLVVAVLSFVVPVFLIVAIVQLITGGMRTDRSQPEMSAEAVAARIKPVGEVNVGSVPPPAATAPAATAAAPGAPAAAAPAGATRSGDQVYQQACAMCHAAGLMNAPKLGDKAAWQPRIAQGNATLYRNAIGGIRTMPAKGGNASLPDAEVKAAVDFLVGKAN